MLYLHYFGKISKCFAINNFRFLLGNYAMISNKPCR